MWPARAGTSACQGRAQACLSLPFCLGRRNVRPPGQGMLPSPVGGAAPVPLEGAGSLRTYFTSWAPLGPHACAPPPVRAVPGNALPKIDAQGAQGDIGMGV